jgi:hypothetical protein
MNTRWRRRGAPRCGGSLARPSLCLRTRLLACPSALWQERLWSDQEQPDYPTFWYLTYHTLFWLDLYLTGKTEGFAPPAHFRNPLDPTSAFPTQPYTRDELHTYLKQLHQKCQSTITELSNEQGHQPFHFPWDREHPISYLELQLYTMRHGPRTCGPGFASFSDSTASRASRSTGSRKRRMKRASEARRWEIRSDRDRHLVRG